MVVLCGAKVCVVSVFVGNSWRFYILQSADKVVNGRLIASPTSGLLLYLFGTLTAQSDVLILIPV